MIQDNSQSISHCRKFQRRRLPAGPAHRLRCFRRGVVRDRPQGRKTRSTQEAPQRLSKSRQLKKSVQRTQNDAILPARQRPLMSGHSAGNTNLKCFFFQMHINLFGYLCLCEHASTPNNLYLCTERVWVDAFLNRMKSRFSKSEKRKKIIKRILLLYCIVSSPRSSSSYLCFVYPIMAWQQCLLSFWFWLTFLIWSRSMRIIERV